MTSTKEDLAAPLGWSRRALIVLGVHRSGTSALTRVLSLLGAALPSKLMPAVPGVNDRGFWEPLDAVEIHDELLASAGSSWDDVSPFPESWYTSDLAKAFRKRILDILERDFRESPLFVLKDPRIPRIVPFWLSVLEEFRTEPCFIIIVRNPLEVAASLKARDGFQPGKSFLLWLTHLLDAERHTRGCKRSLVAYEGLLRDWEGVITRISKDLGFGWPRYSHQTRAEIESFLADAGRHHVFAPTDVEARADVVDWVKRAYSAVRLESETSSAAISAVLDAIRAELEIADQAFGPLLAEARVKLSARDAEIRKLSADLQNHAGRVEAQDGELATRDAEIRRLSADVENYAGRVEAQDGELAARDAEIRRLSADLENYAGRVEALYEEAAAKSAALVAEKERAENLENDIPRLVGRIDELEEAFGWHGDSLIRLRQELDKHRDHLSRQEQIATGVQGNVTEVLHGLRGIETSLTHTRNLVETMWSSKFWRALRLLSRIRHGLPAGAPALSIDARQLLDLPQPLRLHRGDFAEWRYLELYPDVKRAVTAGAVASGYFHYENFGRFEGREASRQAAPGEPRPRRFSITGWRYSRREHSELARHFTARLRQNVVALKEVAKPVASIVIAVRGQTAALVECLESIAAASNETSFEVLVVYDSLGSWMREVLSVVPNLRVLRKRRGFGPRNLENLGAKHARGKYIVFLGADTTVTDAWLDTLVRTFADFLDAGMACAKVVTPGGTLEDGGGIIWREGALSLYGDGKDPERPEYNYTREVDYCSMSCLIVPRELFRELGGFDRAFISAGYRVADLSFRARQAGRRLYYQPLAQLTRAEEVATEGKAETHDDQRSLARRWGGVLVGRRTEGQQAELEKDRNFARRTLIIDHRLPTPDQDAGSSRIWELITVLRGLGFMVSFLPYNLEALQPYARQLQARGVEVLWAPFVKSVKEHLEEHGSRYDLVIVCRSPVAAACIDDVRRYCVNARVVFDTVDLHFLREERRAALEQDRALEIAAAQSKRRELEMVRKADATLVVSQVEKELLKEEDPAANVHVVSLIQEPRSCRRGFKVRKDLYFIGGFEHTPNVDASKWLVCEIFPLIRKRIPSVHLYLIGSKPPDEVLRLQEEQVTVTGYVADVEPYFSGCRVCLAPLRYGAGLKGKVVQSMGYGVPCVVTSVGAEGMRLKHRVDAMIADNAQEFADCAVEVYETEALWNALSECGIETVRENFSLQRAQQAVELLLGSLWAGSRHEPSEVGGLRAEF